MDFWMGVALTLLLETVALIAATEYFRRKIKENSL